MKWESYTVKTAIEKKSLHEEISQNCSIYNIYYKNSNIEQILMSNRYIL